MAEFQKKCAMGGHVSLLDEAGRNPRLSLFSPNPKFKTKKSVSLEEYQALLKQLIANVEYQRELREDERRD